MLNTLMQSRDILMAKVLSPHGILGWVKVYWYGQDPTKAVDYAALYDNKGNPFHIAEWRMQGKVLAVKFKETQDRTAAEKLHGLELFIPRSALPPPKENEYYHVDLIGLAAQTEDGAHLGVVKSVQNFGAGDLLGVEQTNGDVEFYPFNQKAIRRINFEEEIIVLEPVIFIE